MTSVTLTKLPAGLNVVAVKGGPVSIEMRFKNRDIAGNAYTAVIYENTDAGYAAAVAGSPVATLGVTVNATNPGRITANVTKAQMATLSPAKSYRWFAVETASGVDDPIVSGTFVARAP